MRLPLAMALAILVIGATAVGLTRSASSQDPDRQVDGPGVSQERQTPIDDSIDTLLVTVEIDAHGARPVMITRKPGEEYREAYGWQEMPFAWKLRDREGVALAEGGFDPGPVDLDPAHFGEAGRYTGDVHVPTMTATLVAIPNLEDFTKIEFYRRDGEALSAIGSSFSQLIPTR